MTGAWDKYIFLLYDKTERCELLVCVFATNARNATLKLRAEYGKKRYRVKEMRKA